MSKYGGIKFFYCDNFGGFGDCFLSSKSSGCISDRVSLTASKCRMLVIEFDNYQRVFCMAVKDGFVKKLCCKNLNSIGVRDGVGGQGQYWVGRGSIG